MKKLMMACVAAMVMGAFGDTYWRWTSNATADEPTWTEEAVDTLSVPAFTGATAEDNVLELLDDCSVESVLTFSKSCTIRTQTGLAVKSATFAKDCYCVSSSGAAVTTSNITFTGGAQWKNPTAIYEPDLKSGTTAGNCAWVIAGTASLTLGSGTTVCSFNPSSSLPAYMNYCGAIFIPSEKTAAGGGGNFVNTRPVLNIEAGATICDVRGSKQVVVVANKMKYAVINMTGGEITRCSAGGRFEKPMGVFHILHGTFNLSGGSIHDNYSCHELGKGSGNGGGIYVYRNEETGYPCKLNLSGSPVVRDNVVRVSSVDTVFNVDAENAERIHLAGDLAEGAYIGCSRNVGEGNQFGVADQAFVGARRIHADDGSGLVGVVKDVSGTLQLQWSSQVDPDPNRWVVSPAVEPNEWVVDGTPGTITKPVAAFGDATKVATISKDGGDPVEWKPEALPEEPGAYTITWTVPGTDDYAELEGSVEFTVLAETRKYWRWTSNATADEPTWTKSENPVLSVPAFTGATAEDNVLELLDDCSVAEILYFTKSCTICSKADLASAATVTLAKNCYCVCQADEIKTKDVVFTGAADWKNPSDAKSYAVNNDATAGNCAWAIYKSGGGAKLTLGAGTVIRDFRIDNAPTGIANYRGAVILPSEGSGWKTLNSQTPALEICADAQIINVRGLGPAVSVANKLDKATIRMTGGEIAGCFNGVNHEDYRGTVGLVSGSFYLSGGAIHDNYANNGLDRNKKAASGVFSKGNVYLSGNPVVRDNGTQSANGGDYLPHNLQTEGSGQIHLAGDLAEGAYVGCSRNVGEGNPFGVADGKYKGAEFIRADDGSKLVGLVRQGNLVWGFRGGLMIFIR